MKTAIAFVMLAMVLPPKSHFQTTIPEFGFAAKPLPRANRSNNSSARPSLRSEAGRLVVIPPGLQRSSQW